MDPKKPNTTSTSKLAWWKKALFSAIFLTLFFTALELGLWCLGFRPVLYDEDPYVGFSSHIPLFVEETRPDGAHILVTARNKIRFFNAQEFPAKKEKGTYRIFCVGESTTYGHPYDDRTSYCRWLRELLPAADPSRKWEVINAGGISYASYRLALLMEELIDYEPDIFIVYVGHNEFLERRTYSNILEMPAAVRGLGGLLSHTRTYAAMKSLVFGRTAGPARPDPGRAALPGEVDAILDRSVGPAEYTRDDALREQVLAHYRFNLARMTDIARSAGAAVLFVTPASNLRSFEPFKSEHRGSLSRADLERWDSLLESARKAREESRLDDALRLLDEAAAVDDRHAQLQYFRGKVLDSLGRHDDAKAAYTRARDEDICPLRALTPVRSIVLDVAAARGASCVDFVALMEKAAPQGIPGDDLFLDHVHPTIEGHRLLALALIEELARAGTVRPTAAWGDGTIHAVTERVERGLDRSAQGLALKNLAKTLGWAGKFEEARKLGEKAAKALPDDGEVELNLGDAYEKQGDLATALGHYERALKLDAGNAEAWNKLGRVREKRGDLAGASASYEQSLRLRPDSADASGNLGNVLANQGKLAEAVPYLEQAARLDPRNAEALQKLGVTLSKLGNAARAEACLREAIRIRPDFVRARNNLGIILAQRGNVAEAAQQYEESLRLDPGYARAHNSLGNLLASQGKLAEAAEHFAAALRLEPANVEAGEKLRVLAEQLEASVRARPQDAEGHHLLALVLEARGKRGDAAAHEEEALRLEPNHAQAHFHLARLLAEERARGADAARHFAEALRCDPDLTAAAAGLAWLLATHPDAGVRNGPEALRWAEQAARSAPRDDIAALEALAAAYAAVGRFDSAAATQARAAEAARTRRSTEQEAIEARGKLYREGRPYLGE